MYQQIKGIDPNTGEETTRPSTDDGPFAALAFKIMADPYVGKLAFFRVYSGTLESGSYVFNSTKGKKRTYRPYLANGNANSRQEIDRVYAGDIASSSRS